MGAQKRFSKDSTKKTAFLDDLSSEELKIITDFSAIVKKDKRIFDYVKDITCDEFVARKLGVSIPLSIFKIRKLSSLELVTKYLKENHNFSYHDIATLLNRDDRTIWTTYKNSLLKLKQKLYVNKPDITVPISIFSNRSFSPLESLVYYLKFELKFSQKRICELLDRGPTTISTVLTRAWKKS